MADLSGRIEELAVTQVAQRCAVQAMVPSLRTAHRVAARSEPYELLEAD